MTWVAIVIVAALVGHEVGKRSARDPRERRLDLFRLGRARRR